VKSVGRKSKVQVDEDKVISLYLEGKSCASVALLFEGMKGFQVEHILRKNGIPRRSNRENSRKYDVNHHFFDVIDTEEKAYWLGFLAADGYVTTKEDKVGLSLGIKDHEHLQKFAKAIESTYPIGTYKTSGYADTEYCRLIVTSKPMKSALIKHGLTEKKTLILKYPDTVPMELEHHFIRGYFDGDGSLAKDGNGGYQIKICGTEAILRTIQSCLPTSINKLYKRKKDEKDNWYFSIGGRQQVIRILDDLYFDSTIHLERKFERYQELCSQSLASVRWH
jgi:DNA-binding transcriptional regulator WhiA